MSANNEILIFGAGGHASKLIEVFKSDNLKIKGYISTEKPGTIINKITVLKTIDDYLADQSLHKHLIHIGIGENYIRYKIHKTISAIGAKYINCISKHSIISESVNIGTGTCIMASSVINANSSIGSFCIIDTMSLIEHDTIIEDYVNVSPGAVLCGKAHIKKGAIIGAGSTIIEKVKVGENALIGAGSVVIKDVEPNSVMVGNPARKIRDRNFNELYLN